MSIELVLVDLDFNYERLFSIWWHYILGLLVCAGVIQVAAFCLLVDEYLEEV